MKAMLNESITKFLSVASELLQDICENERMYEPYIYDDYALLPYALRKPMKIEELKPLIEEQDTMRLYYLLKIEDGRESICAYSNPCIQPMFKINAITDNSGYVFDVNVTVYDSLEIMSSDLINEIRLLENCHFVFKKEAGEFLADFT